MRYRVLSVCLLLCCGVTDECCCCRCSDLISCVFPALSCCLLHLWSHLEGWCRTESVPLHVGDTRYLHLANACILWSLQCISYVILYLIPVVFSVFVSRPRGMAWGSTRKEPGCSQGPAQPTKQTLIPIVVLSEQSAHTNIHLCPTSIVVIELYSYNKCCGNMVALL